LSSREGSKAPIFRAEKPVLRLPGKKKEKYTNLIVRLQVGERPANFRRTQPEGEENLKSGGGGAKSTYQLFSENEKKGRGERRWFSTVEKKGKKVEGLTPAPKWGGGGKKTSKGGGGGRCRWFLQVKGRGGSTCFVVRWVERTKWGQVRSAVERGTGKKKIGGRGRKDLPCL